MRQFGALQGNIASRFSGMGSGARKSSGFQNANTSAAQQLSESLQSQRMGLQSNAIEQLLGISNSLLGRQTQETGFFPKGQSGWQSFLGGIGGGLGSGLGRYFGRGF